MKTTVLPARSHSKVALAELSQGDSLNTKGLDKLIVPLSYTEENPVRVAWGPTIQNEWVQVANTSSEPVTIKKGQVLAHLKCSKDEWTINDFDLSDLPPRPTLPKEEERGNGKEDYEFLLRTLTKSPDDGLRTIPHVVAFEHVPRILEAHKSIPTEVTAYKSINTELVACKSKPTEVNASKCTANGVTANERGETNASLYDLEIGRVSHIPKKVLESVRGETRSMQHGYRVPCTP